MAAAVNYFATAEDQATLLNYLGEPDQVTLHPWPLLQVPPDILNRKEALATPQVMVVNRDLGPPVSIRLGDPAMDEPTKSGAFHRLNWQGRPDADEGVHTAPELRRRIRL